jgi:hypothetical protein
MLYFLGFFQAVWIRFPPPAFKSIEAISAALALNAALPSQSRITQLPVP